MYRKIWRLCRKIVETSSFQMVYSENSIKNTLHFKKCGNLTFYMPVYPSKFVIREKSGFLAKNHRFLDQVVIDRAPGNIFYMLFVLFSAILMTLTAYTYKIIFKKYFLKKAKTSILHPCFQYLTSTRQQKWLSDQAEIFLKLY